MSEEKQPVSPLLAEALQYYRDADEAERLFRRAGVIERLRTQELIARYAPVPPARIYDIGGGPGAYALWLARQSYEVHLLDAVPHHIEQASAASLQQIDTPLASVQLGDARHLPFADESADVVLLFGPLYHLTDRADRLLALREGRRVLRPGGWLLAATISCFASLLDNLSRRPEIFNRPEETAMIAQDLAQGQHRNPTGDIVNFTTTYFHHPDELRTEVEAVGLEHRATLAIEGPFWLVPASFDYWSNPDYKQQFLRLLRMVEQEPTLLGASSHLMAVARKTTG